MDIHNREFKHSFRGYDEDDVDSFLDQIVNDYSRVIHDNEKLKSDVQRLRKDNEQYAKLEKNLKDTLLVAQKTADEVTTNAKTNADEMLKNTAQECQNMRREAELMAKQTVGVAEDKVRALTTDYNRLLQEKRRFLKKIQYMMAQELSSVEATIDNLPEEAEVEAKAAEQKAEATDAGKAEAAADKAAAKKEEDKGKERESHS